jgi:hypothetical protein
MSHAKYQETDAAAEIEHLCYKNAQLRGVVCFFASVIKCGEPWSDECQAELERVLSPEDIPDALKHNGTVERR